MNLRDIYQKNFNEAEDNEAVRAALYLTLYDNFNPLFKVDLKQKDKIMRTPLVLNQLLDLIDIVSKDNFLKLVVPQVKVALEIVSQGFNKDEKQVCEMYMAVGKKLSEYAELYQSAETSLTDGLEYPDFAKKFDAFFDYYKKIYIQYYSIISSLPSYCYELLINTKNIPTYYEYIELETSYKTSPKRLGSHLFLSGEKINILTNGCNKHIRNALSHNRYKFSNDGKTVELHDIDPRTKKVIWRSNFTFEQFRDQTQILRATILSIRIMMNIFYINEFDKIKKYQPKNTQNIKELEKLCYEIAKGSYLDFKKVALNSSSEITVEVSLQKRVEKKYAIQTTRGIVNITKDDKLLATQIIGRFINTLYIYSGEIYSTIKVVLSDSNGNLKGEIIAGKSYFPPKDYELFMSKVDKNTIPKDLLALE